LEVEAPSTQRQLEILAALEDAIHTDGRKIKIVAVIES
jgi:hypothetical protein